MFATRHKYIMRRVDLAATRRAVILRRVEIVATRRKIIAARLILLCGAVLILLGV